MIEICTFLSLLFSVVSNEEVIKDNIQIIQDKIEAEKVVHIETPENVKSLYYTAYATTVADKMNNLYYLAKNKEINSVTLDIKTVSGYTSFEFDENMFWDIKPTSNNIITDIKPLIKKLHEEDIYVIWRVVLFKDKLLAEKRPDLAIKWIGTNDVWTDYKWKKYMDPWAKEVHDYNIELAAAAYKLGFDEINFDYVRYPSDGKISQTYYPHSSEADLEKWWKIKSIDRANTYINNQLELKVPELKVSADVFGLVTNVDLFQIGQNLESFVVNYDYVWPMIYPSHYGVGYLGYTVPDNAPYEIFKDSIATSNERIDNLNNYIQTSTWATHMVADIFTPVKDLSNQPTFEKNIVRPWIQGFWCTRCAGATPYTRTKFRKQIQAIEELWAWSWWVWSSWSNYYPEWYNNK